ncbi:MAG TPA: succinate dehydrogenase, cytochrome b556 subunit [Steroidobacteraceae bacterium]|nr:succinate dehydrogenase, cytochrome b556 subunit [Steroidobacteraceae bacterium]
MAEIIEFPRPKSPHLQNYRPQLTSVLSFANRVSGIALALAAVGLVAWLAAGASGAAAYGAFDSFLSSIIGRILLLVSTLALFFHLCGGIRHIAWDAVLGFELRSIYASGWAVIAATLLLTAATWIAAYLIRG